MIPRRTLEECLTLLGEIEASIAAVELALTRLELALARLPADGKLVGRSKLLETAEIFRACLDVLSQQHQLMLVDIERKRSAPFASLLRSIRPSPSSLLRNKGDIYQAWSAAWVPPTRSTAPSF